MSEELKNEVNTAIAAIKELVSEIESHIPNVIAGNKTAARKARNNLNSLKKYITPLRKNIQEIVKPSKPA